MGRSVMEKWILEIWALKHGELQFFQGGTYWYLSYFCPNRWSHCTSLIFLTSSTVMNHFQQVDDLDIPEALKISSIPLDRRFRTNCRPEIHGLEELLAMKDLFLMPVLFQSLFGRCASCWSLRIVVFERAIDKLFERLEWKLAWFSSDFFAVLLQPNLKHDKQVWDSIEGLDESCWWKTRVHRTFSWPFMHFSRL